VTIRLIAAFVCGFLFAQVPNARADVPQTVKQLNSAPPRIVVSTRPARLMMVDGPPATVDIPATSLAFVVNTDWDVFQDHSDGSWYILDHAHWLRGNMLSSGDWLATTDLPQDFLTLQVSSEWPQVAQAMPPRKPAEPPLPIVISYEPTELIIVDGEMQFEPIGGGALQYVSNTESDLFFHDGRYYYLAAGRWFTTKNVDRKWYAVETLPRAFAEIPESHPRSRVLVSVPGTEAARLSAREAAVPQRTEVTISGGDIDVPWLGAPSFVPIEGTGLRRAENTPFQVIQHNNFYYLCHEGAWYSASRAEGPWRAAREIPDAIYDIPATDPTFNVTFVRLDSFDDDSGRAAYVSTSGYYNRYYNGMTLVYGTGWYYPGYYGRSAYWRYPHTYGYYGPWGAYRPYYYHYSESIEIDRTETDWQWDLDGGKRRVYMYGPQNYVGGKYTMPKSNIHKPGGKE
jgi:hypothetical protein